MSTKVLNSTELSLSRLTTLPELADIAERWNELAQGVPFCSWEWLSTWWRFYCGPQDQLCAVVIRDTDERIVAIAPWYLSNKRSQGRVIRLLGSGEICSDYVTVLCEPELRAVVIERLARYLTDEASNDWDLLELSGIAQHDETVEGLSRTLIDRKHLCLQTAQQSCWSVALPTDWDQYLAKLSKSRRERTRKLYRQEYLSGCAKLQMVVREDQLARAFELLIELHQRRRNSLGQAGCFASERFLRFHRSITQQFFELGKLRMLWLELEGRPAAVEYGLVGNDTVYYYQGGFDPDLSDRRPGWLAFSGSLKLAIEQGYRKFDFLRGDEPYKASWAAQPQPLRDIVIAGRHPMGMVRFVTRQAQRGVRRAARQGWNLAASLSAKCRSSATPPTTVDAHKE
jgi:CelD/BcsL family acetyltransferase involved in cellulose biosynthesis